MFGEIDEDRNLKYEFVKLDDTEFANYEQNVDKLNSKEDLIEKLNELNLDENKLYEIIFTGNRNFEINTREIFKLITKSNILKLKDCTDLRYNLDEIKNERNLKRFICKRNAKEKRREYLYR